MITIDYQLQPNQMKKKLALFWQLSAEKIASIDRSFDHSKGSPVYTVDGKYSTRGWTEWTQGFEYGSAILQFDATGDLNFLNAGRSATLERMAPHLTHAGVHDHGFNNLSTYGNLLRLMHEGKIPSDSWERSFYELALKVSGAVQAGRWTSMVTGGFIHSFNGPHSLFVDTIRSCRILIVAHLLGHFLQGENDRKISLLHRAVEHISATADYSVYYGKGRDSYDVRGRTAHESIFNPADGHYRCPNAQQGYSGFTTWTRGLAWAMVGFAEQLEAFQLFSDADLVLYGGKEPVEKKMLEAARAVCDFYIENTPVDGIPYWDTGAPNLHKVPQYLDRPADPYNGWEPVDSSAAAIGAQGLLRLGKFLNDRNETTAGTKYWQAGLTVLNSLFDYPYLSTNPAHQGLILHSIYHQPNGWDHIPAGQKIACGESSMWGDYHAREVALYLQRTIRREAYYTFFGGAVKS